MNVTTLYRDLRIRSKLVLMIALLIGGISVFISIYFPGRQEMQELRALSAKARSIADMTAFTVAPALQFRDRRTLGESFDAARQNRGLVYLVAFDDSGRIAGAYDLAAAEKAEYTVPDRDENIATDQTVYRVTSPVTVDGAEIGRVYLGLSLKDLRDDTGKARSAMLLVSLVIFTVGTLSVVGIGTIITVPLRKMVSAARQITLGDLSIRAPVMSGDEVGQLAGTFNSMVENLQATHRVIEETNRSLERRVEARTEELRRQIADREKAEEKLRQSEEQFRLISENVADMIALLDTEGRRVYSSPSYRAVLGDSRDLKGTDSFNEIHPDDREKIREIFAKTVRTGNGMRAEYRFLLRDGSVRHIESQGSVVRDVRGKVSHVIVVSRDMTEKKILERQFLRAQRMESLGTLASGIAHDLNNVLSPILMSIDILRSRFPGETNRRVLDALEASAKRGSNIVKQVLAFGRGLAGERIILQPKHIIREVAKIVEETFPKSIIFGTDIPRNLWTLSADPTQMHQVILNVCVNARDAMPKGGHLRISAANVMLDEASVRMETQSKPGPFVAISIADTGTGIPAEIIEKIFEPFFTTKELGQGTGLGLSTTLGIVKSHQGFIDVRSDVGGGTTFTVFLPAQTNGRPEDIQEEDVLPEGHGELILAVDDEAPIREIMQETLGECGFRVVTARNGNEALRIYAEQRGEIRLVITDMMMPDMDGTATIQALRAHDPGLKIIAVSGLMGVGDGPARVDSGATRFLPKPHTTRELLLLVSEVLAMN
jgi:two-component system, cell cycle sensor histidine kinase and response regulator CckA